MSAWRQRPDALYSASQEEAVIGGLLMWPNRLHEFELRADEFYLPETRAAYEAILSLTYDRGGAVDALTVADEIKRQGYAAPDVARLAEMSARILTSELIPRYAQTIRLYGLRRKVLQALSEQQAKVATCELDDIVGSVETMQRAVVGAASVRGKIEDITPVFDAMVARLRAIAAGESPARLRTHIRAIDDICGGLPYAHPTMVGGRPSNGKSLLARTIVDNVTNGGIPAGYISLEDAPIDIVQWQALRRARIGIERIVQEIITQPEIDRIADLRARVTKLPLSFVREGVLTPPQVCQRIRQLKATKGIKLAVVDYLQLLSLPGERSTTEELGEGVKMIVGACQETGIASLILSQLNRRSEEEKRRPQLGDFKQCGGIEEAAEVAILVHREWKMRRDANKPRFSKALEAIVAKLKQGEPATAWCYFEGALGYVCDPEPGFFTPEMDGGVPFCMATGCEKFALYNEDHCGLHHTFKQFDWPKAVEERPRYAD